MIGDLKQNMAGIRIVQERNPKHASVGFVLSEYGNVSTTWEEVLESKPLMVELGDGFVHPRPPWNHVLVWS